MSKNSLCVCLMLCVPMIIYAFVVLYLASSLDTDCFHQKCSLLIEENSCSLTFVKNNNETCLIECDRHKYNPKEGNDVVCYQNIHDMDACPKASTQYCTNWNNIYAIFVMMVILAVLEACILIRVEKCLKRSGERDKYIELS